MQIVTIPPITLSPLSDSTTTWQYIEGQTPVDFTASADGQSWSAEALIESCGHVYWRARAVLSPDGFVEVSVPAAVAEQIRSDRRGSARIQITFSAPIPDMSECWSGPVVIAEVVK